MASSSSKSEKQKPPSKIGGGKWEIEKKLGAGCFGEVWRGVNVQTKQQVAVKFESASQNHALQLEHEAEILKLMATPPPQPQGFAECHYWGHEGRYHALVMEMLGKSLEDYMSACKNKFTNATAALVAEQVLRRMEYLHSKCIIHRDIKPENFMFGIGDKVHHLYLIDFGLSKKYFDTGKHVQMRTKLSLTGTARYASINAHKGIEQSRRDDLEAIGHMIIYFLRGSLPWSGLEAKTQEEKYRKIREKKEQVKLEDLCEGFPDAFKEYLSRARNLEFKERPDYEGLRKLFRDVRDAEGNKAGKPVEDWNTQWFTGDPSKLIPLISGVKLRQPDDVEPKRSMFSCCGKSNVRE